MTGPTLDRAMVTIMACLMLLSVVPATAGAWRPQTTGTMGAMQPRGQTARIETSRDDTERAVRGTQGLSLLFFISGILLGLCVRFRVPHGGSGRDGGATWTGSPPNSKRSFGRAIRGKSTLPRGCHSP